jgi:hypothetical protein
MPSNILNKINLYQYKNRKWVLEVICNGDLVFVQSTSNLKTLLEQKEQIKKKFFNDFNDSYLIKNN